MVSQKTRPQVKLRKSGLLAKLWPDGQIVFYHRQRERQQAEREESDNHTDSLLDCVNRAYSGDERLEALRSVGLSNVAISDKKTKAKRSGLSGMSSLGKTRIRNAAYMLKRDSGKERLTFATVTLPPMSTEDMATVHVHWGKVIERYRLEVKRALRLHGLPGEIIGVTEVQEKRYEKTGYPVLHAHFLFVGFSISGGWAITPAQHDTIWRKCIYSILPRQYGPELNFRAACNLQPVRKDPGAYLAKYMSKGIGVINRVIEDGLEWWLPRQWWNCSRSLIRRMNAEIRIFSEGAYWLMDRAAEKSDMFIYYREIMVELKNGDVVMMAAIASLSPWANKKVREFLEL